MKKRIIFNDIIKMKESLDKLPDSVFRASAYIAIDPYLSSDVQYIATSETDQVIAIENIETLMFEKNRGGEWCLVI